MQSLIRFSNQENVSVFLVIFLFLLTACTGPQVDPRIPPDFSGYQDRPLPPEVAIWLMESPQTRGTPGIAAVADQIRGMNRRERLYKAVDYVWANFTYDNWLNDKAFTRSAGELFETRVLGGCSDFALAQVALFRAVGVPARMVLTANTEWMAAFKENDLLITTGHVFIEAYLEDRWLLIDSTYRLLFEGYDPAARSFPRNEYLFKRARDYWSLGITDVASLDRVYQPMARMFDLASYVDPKYPATKVYARWKWKKQ
ncbi:MAG: transglutaminase domain-containing protein [Desulfobacterales bacterium]|nr:transglutaminase domain-containing protein [Desulfobacterales bacterium]